MALTGFQILDAAYKYQGVPYYEGNPQGKPPNGKGFDCSGLVQQVMSDLGVKIARTTSAQLADANSGVVGKNVGTNIKDAQIGDIIHYVGHEEIWATLPTQKGTPQVFSEATTGTVAATRNWTGWPVIGIVRYADSGVGKPAPTGVGGDPGQVSGQLTDIVPGLNSVVSSVSSILGVLGTITKLFTFVLDPKNWWRVALALFGTALLILALLRLTKTPTTAVIQGSSTAASTARKLAESVPVE